MASKGWGQGWVPRAIHLPPATHRAPWMLRLPSSPLEPPGTQCRPRPALRLQPRCLSNHEDMGPEGISPGNEAFVSPLELGDRTTASEMSHPPLATCTLPGGQHPHLATCALPWRPAPSPGDLCPHLAASTLTWRPAPSPGDQHPHLATCSLTWRPVSYPGGGILTWWPAHLHQAATI